MLWYFLLIFFSIVPFHDDIYTAGSSFVVASFPNLSPLTSCRNNQWHVFLYTYRLMCIKIHYIPTSKNGSYKPPPTTLPWPMREGHVAATTPLDPCQRPINMRRKREKGRRSSSSGSRVISIGIYIIFYWVVWRSYKLFIIPLLWVFLVIINLVVYSYAENWNLDLWLKSESHEFFVGGGESVFTNYLSHVMILYILII